MVERPWRVQVMREWRLLSLELGSGRPLPGHYTDRASSSRSVWYCRPVGEASYYLLNRR